jgi:hypothetical protein
MTILEKNHQIWIKYNGEKLDTKFNYKLKEEMRTIIPIELGQSRIAIWWTACVHDKRSVSAL